MDAATTHERRWIGLMVLCLSLTIIGLDNTILNVALRSIADDLSASTSQLQWIVDGYTLVFAGLLLTSGSLGDRFGRRTALSVGLVIFAAGSIASVFATSAAHLIITRSVMGVGGSLIMPATLSLLTNLFPDPRERAKAIGVWAGVSGIGVAVGPLLGGWLLTHFSWGSVFLINVPVVAIALPAGYFLLPNSKSAKGSRLDPVGAVLSVVGLVSLVWAIIEAPGKGWTSPVVLGAFTVAAVALGSFVWWQLHSDHPMLDVRIFENRRFTAASLAVTLTFFALFGSMFLLTQFMQYVLGYTPLQAGARSIPIAVMLMIGGPLAARLTERFGTKRMVAGGLFIVGAGLTVASTATPELGYLARVLPAQLLLGLGISLAMAPATESIMGSLPRDMAGVGSAVNDTTRQIGGAMGVAIIGSIFAGAYRPAVDSSLGSLAGTIGQGPGGDEALAAVRDSIGGAFGVAARAGGDPRVIDTESGRQIAAAAQDAFAHSMGQSMLVAAAFAVAGGLIALAFLPATAGEGEALEPGDPRADLPVDRDGEVEAERDLVPAS